MERVPGLHDVKLLRDFGQPNLDLTIDRRQAARFGINVTDIQDAVQRAGRAGGNGVSQVWSIGEQRYGRVVKYATSSLIATPVKRSRIFASYPQPESGCRWRN